MKNVYRCDLSLNGFFEDIGIIRSFLQTFSSHLTWPVSENPASFPKFNLSRSRTLSQHNQTAPRKQSYIRLWNMLYIIYVVYVIYHYSVTHTYTYMCHKNRGVWYIPMTTMMKNIIWWNCLIFKIENKWWLSIIWFFSHS